MSAIEKRAQFVDVMHLSEFFSQKEKEGEEDTTTRASLSSLEEDLKVLDGIQRTVGARRLRHAQLGIKCGDDERFEFDFFHVINQVLVKMTTGSINRTDRSLHLLLIYCLNKCSEQYQLFRTGEIGSGEDSYQDLINIVELLDQFRNSLLSLMHRFKQVNSHIEVTTTAAAAVAYQNLAPAILSIYVDTVLMLKSKTRQLEEAKSRVVIKNLKQTLTVNIFYLLDSKVKSIYDLILQLSSLNEPNMKYIFPLIEKAVDCMSQRRRRQRRDSKIKTTKRVYVRVLLTFAKIRLALTDNSAAAILTSSSEEEDVHKQKHQQYYLDAFESLIDQIAVSKRLYSFIHKILTRHVSKCERSSVFMKLLCKINLNGLNSLRLRDFIMFKMKEEQLVLFLKALANKQLKSSGYDKRLLFNSRAVKKQQPVAASVIELQPVESKLDDQTQVVKKQEEEEQQVDTEQNELDFTSDYSIFSYSDEELVVETTTTTSIVECTKIEDKNAALVEAKVEKTRVTTQAQPEPQPPQVNKSRYNLRSRSPTRDTISKLDLFRNIFGDERILQEFNKIPQVESCGSSGVVVGDGNEGDDEFETKRDKFNLNVNKMSSSHHHQHRGGAAAAATTDAVSKFYKLNDLVSIMINEDFFKPVDDKKRKRKATVAAATSTPNF